MGLHIAAWIIINWMLTIAWLDSSRQYYIPWACMTALVWWIGWIRRSPPWPTRPEQRLLIYGMFIGPAFILAVFIGRWQAYVIIFVFIVLWLIEQRRRRTA